MSRTIPKLALTFTLATALCLCTNSASATDIDLVALSNGKAMLIIDGKAPKNYTVGAVINGTIKLISIENNAAVIEFDGKRQILQLGRTVLQNSTDGNPRKLVLQGNELGHFFTSAQINGGSSIRVMIDTGSSFLAMSSAEATRLGIDFRKGAASRSSTANGIVPVYRVRLDSVKIGEIEIFQVDAAVHESELPIALLGMSFLNRLTMVREGQQMTLTKKN